MMIFAVFVNKWLYFSFSNLIFWYMNIIPSYNNFLSWFRSSYQKKHIFLEICWKNNVLWIAGNLRFCWFHHLPVWSIYDTLEKYDLFFGNLFFKVVRNVILLKDYVFKSRILESSQKVVVRICHLNTKI